MSEHWAASLWSWKRDIDLQILIDPDRHMGSRESQSTLADEEPCAEECLPIKALRSLDSCD